MREGKKMMGMQGYFAYIQRDILEREKEKLIKTKKKLRLII